MNRNYAAATLMLLPLEAVVFKLAFRRVGNLNYPEWLVITTFLTAQTFVIMAFALPFERWFPHARGGAVALSSVYGIFTLMQFFKGYARWKALLRGLFAYGFFMLVSAAFGFVFAVVLLALSGSH